jgi:two-component system LytT family response regulator
MDILIIDDEPKARNLLRTIISEGKLEVSSIREAGDLMEGIKLIREMDPTIIFLDIEMPNLLGTEIFNYFDKDEMNFEIVFTTAYDQYALRAFEMNAVDYILKPLRPKRVLDVIDRVQKNQSQSKLSEKFVELHQTLTSKKFNKIGLPVNDGILFVPLVDIIHMEADGMYTTFYLLNGDKKVVSKPLKHFVSILESGNGFYRPHRSHVINIQFLKQYVKKDGNYVILENDHVVPISKDKREEFLNLLTNI